MSDYLDQLAEFALALTSADLPDDVLELARLQLLDTVGVIVGGMHAKPVRALARRLARDDGRCRALGLDLRLSARHAALVHGAAGTWLDFDAGHRWSGGHPAIHVLAAALALAESESGTGADLLAAFVAGSEVACRIGLAKGPSAPNLHPHGSWPVFGAIAAVGRLSHLTVDQIRRAMDLASTLTLTTSWNTAFVGASIRNAYAGLGAELAIRAVEWTLAGWDGEPDGVGVVFGKIAANGINRRRAVIELGQTWEFTTSYFKPYPFARFGHNAIDILAELRVDRPFEADEVERIDVRVGAIGARMNAQHPGNDLQARFSTPQAIGLLLVNGRIDPWGFSGEALADERVRAVAGRVFVAEDVEWEALSPRWRGATVEVRLSDGTVLAGDTGYPRGDPEKPLSRSEIEAKFLSLVEPVVGIEAARAALSALVDVERLGSVAPIVDPLAGS